MCHNLGILYQEFQWYLRIETKFSADQFLPFQILHASNSTPSSSRLSVVVCTTALEGEFSHHHGLPEKSRFLGDLRQPLGILGLLLGVQVISVHSAPLVFP